MSHLYHDAHRDLQDHFDTRRLADRLEQVTMHDALSPGDAEFIRRRDMVFLATCDATGQPTCSIKCGAPGFIDVLDARTLALPWYDGNGMFLSAGNVAATNKLGLLFVDFEKQKRLRAEGDAALVNDPAMTARYVGAQFVIRIALVRVYPNCPRYIPTYQPVSASVYLPNAETSPPVPAWKRADWARDVLPRPKT